MSRVLVIGDPHEPVCHPGYRPWCRYLRNKFKTTKTVIIGDICDHHAISFHAANPMCPGADDERILTKQKIKGWYRDFPKVIITIGNHDARVFGWPSQLVSHLNIYVIIVFNGRLPNGSGWMTSSLTMCSTSTVRLGVDHTRHTMR